MTTPLRFAAVAAIALALGAAVPPIFAADAMSGDAMMSNSMMSEDDAMAAECLEKAEAEPDKAKMEMMVAECHEMYPDAMMEGDSMTAGEGGAMAPAN